MTTGANLLLLWELRRARKAVEVAVALAEERACVRLHVTCALEAVRDGEFGLAEAILHDLAGGLARKVVAG